MEATSESYRDIIFTSFFVAHKSCREIFLVAYSGVFNFNSPSKDENLASFDGEFVFTYLLKGLARRNIVMILFMGEAVKKLVELMGMKH